MWGALAVFRSHWVCPAHGACALRPSTLLRLQAALQGAGPELRAVPIFGSSTKAQTRLGLRSVPSPAGAALAARSLTGALSPGAMRLTPSVGPASVSTRTGSARLVSVLWSWSLAATFPVDVNHPGAQEVFGQKLEACLQFGRGYHIWGCVCPFPFPTASCLQQGMGRSAASQLFSGIAQSFLCS